LKVPVMEAKARDFIQKLRKKLQDLIEAITTIWDIDHQKKAINATSGKTFS